MTPEDLKNIIYGNGRVSWSTAEKIANDIAKVEADAAPESDAVEFADFLVDLKVLPIGGGIWEVHGKGVIHEDGKTGGCPVMKTKDIYDKLFKNKQ